MEVSSIMPSKGVLISWLKKTSLYLWYLILYYCDEFLLLWFEIFLCIMCDIFSVYVIQVFFLAVHNENKTMLLWSISCVWAILTSLGQFWITIVVLAPLGWIVGLKFCTSLSWGDNEGHENRTSHGRISYYCWSPVPQTSNSLKSHGLLLGYICFRPTRQASTEL